MKFKSKYLASALAMVMLVGAGCRHNTNPNNPGAPVSPEVATTITLLDASNTCVTVEDGLTAAGHALDQLQAGEPEYYAKVKPLLKKISALNLVAAQKVQTVKNTGQGDWKSAMSAVGSSVTPSDLTTFGFKNPNTQLIVNTSFATLIATLTAIQKNFGGAK